MAHPEIFSDLSSDEAKKIQQKQKERLEREKKKKKKDEKEARDQLRKEGYGKGPKDGKIVSTESDDEEMVGPTPQKRRT